MSKKKLVVGNWKMYIETPEAAKKLASGLRKRSRTFVGTDVWLASSFTLIPTASMALKGSNIKVGAQSVSQFDDASHTGQVSAAMLKAAGASFVIVGHSEERAVGTTDEAVHAQLARAVGSGLVAILCVGERERDQAGTHFAFIEGQLRSAFAGVQSLASKIIIAYEPVWAIGKSAGDAMKPAEVEETVIFIKKVLADILGREKALKVQVLYGGSVEPDNAAALITESGVNGFLVGHASASIESFIDILKASKK